MVLAVISYSGHVKPFHDDDDDDDDDMTKEAQSSFTDDVWDVEQAGTLQNFIVGHEVVPADVQCLMQINLE